MAIGHLFTTPHHSAKKKKTTTQSKLNELKEAIDEEIGL